MAYTPMKMVGSLYEVGGEGSPSNLVKFKGQDFKQLKEDLLNQKKMFKDKTFPADHSSLGILDDQIKGRLNDVKWLRPHDIDPNATLFKVAETRFDFKQGNIGDCWFLAAIGALTFHESLIKQVVPDDQSLKDKYAGIFHFRFWRFGKWVEVVIDDLLPTINKVPVSVSAKSTEEYWAPLLEKAYAKICGSYGDLTAGNPAEAFKDFSGGVTVNYTLLKSPSLLWDIISRAVHCKAMMACDTFSGEKWAEIYNNCGLVPGHAFAVTGARRLESNGKKVPLVRIWNPWGETEWNGDWSDKSELWATVNEEDRNHCLRVREDGEFWMKLEDFCTYYQELDICCDSPNFLDGDTNCEWNCSLKEGCWEAGKSAGGSDYKTEKFWTNPQYRLTVKEVDRESKGDNNILLSLLQESDEKHRRKVKYHSMGFIIYKMPARAPRGQLSSLLFKDKEPLHVSEFVESRELLDFCSLEPGEYLIIPCTDTTDKTTSFVITVYSKGETEMEQRRPRGNRGMMI